MKINLGTSGIDSMVRSLDRLSGHIQERSSDLATELAKIGEKSASQAFQSAQYAGENDVKVRIERSGPGRRRVVASGHSVLFIEFGTGVKYPDSHPEAAKHGMKRGAYGYKLGRLKSGWRYKGDPGNLGQIITEGKHAGEIHTFGNPANRCMYNSQKEVRERAAEVARRTLGK